MTSSNNKISSHRLRMIWAFIFAILHNGDCFSPSNIRKSSFLFATSSDHQKDFLDSSSPVLEESDADTTIKEYYTRFSKFRTPPYHAPHIKRILLLSDLHTDYPDNQEWLYNLCCRSSGRSSSENNTAIISSESSPIEIEKDTMIIIAGDISHNIEILQWTFQTLKRRYGEVIYTPGNHELWLDKPRRLKRKVATTLDADDDDTNNKDKNIGEFGRSRCKSSGKGDGCINSVDKLEKILELCLQEDIRIGPVRVGSNDVERNDSKNESRRQQSNNGNTRIERGDDNCLWVIPFLSWHHTSFDTEPAIEGWGGIPSARKVVADYRRTSWPLGLSSLDDSAAKFIDGLNDVILDFDDVVNMDCDATKLLTFSHFLPRVELLPEKRYLSLPTLHSCVGSTYLEERIRQLKSKYNTSYNGINEDESSSHLHAFGHSHLAWDATIDGIRYIHVPLAYPREWEQRRRSLEIGTMRGEESWNRYPVCIWEESKPAAVGSSEERGDNIDIGAATHYYNTHGFPSRWLGGWWSKYYTVMPRQPHKNQVLAPWAAKRFR